MFYARFARFWNHPVGPKTTHFWGPALNWGFVAAAVSDMGEPPEKISKNMTCALAIYSGIFMRFAWQVNPRNYLLLGCHVFNEGAQLYQLKRRITYENTLVKDNSSQLVEAGQSHECVDRD
jgi:hypothetical protein